MRLNNLFNTEKNIIDELANYGSKLPDHIFTQAIGEFSANEEEVMGAMYNSDKYEFERYETGWLVSLKEAGEQKS